MHLAGIESSSQAAQERVETDLAVKAHEAGTTPANTIASSNRCRAPSPGGRRCRCQYFTKHQALSSPTPVGHHLPMEPPARRYLCACCRNPVLVCSRCDRGNRYCKECAPKQRRNCVRAAGQRYQASRRGRHAHAQRQRHWRAKRAKVTHQGSPSHDLPALLPPEATAIEVETPQPPWQCHFCGCDCVEFVRIDFLRRRIRRLARLTHQKEPHHARDP